MSGPIWDWGHAIGILALVAACMPGPMIMAIIMWRDGRRAARARERADRDAARARHPSSNPRTPQTGA